MSYMLIDREKRFLEWNELIDELDDLAFEEESERKRENILKGTKGGRRSA